MALPKKAIEILKKKIPEGTLRRMEEIAKVVGDLPPLEDQAEWEAELLRELEKEQQPTSDKGEANEGE